MSNYVRYGRHSYEETITRQNGFCFTRLTSDHDIWSFMGSWGDDDLHSWPVNSTEHKNWESKNKEQYIMITF